MASTTSGRRFLHYELVEKLGEGGMGVVWKATDTVLDREVAIKFLPDVFAADTERMARFEREARLLGSLNHPNIATVYGLHEADATRFIAMELVPGETLARRLKRGAMPLYEALDVARQVALALESAHERGVIHRDLKPANVKVTDEGQVRVLDFGLAKSFASEAATGFDTDFSPTLTSDRTRNGVILGTAAYMSPEQARGGTVDKRTDIWAFGCLLYEILTGTRAFRGTTTTDVLAEVLKGEPAWELLPADTPAEIARLIRRSLVKSIHDRLHDAADARLVIDDVLSQLSSPRAVPRPALEGMASRRGRRFGLVSLTATAATALLVGLLVGPFLHRSEEAPGRSMYGSFSIELPEGLSLPLDPCVPFAFSPDGMQIVLVGEDDSGRRLYRRHLESFELEPLSGTEDAMGPVFSPDGQWIAYVDMVAGQLEKIAAKGGAALPLAAATRNSKGLHWGTEDRLVLTPSYATGFEVVDADTGAVVLETRPDRAQREKTHRYPHLLPNGDAVLFMRATVDLYSYSDARIEIQDLASDTRKLLIEQGASPAYVPTGHILFARDGALLAAPFHPGRAELAGPVVEVLDEVTISNSSGNAFYSVSPAGHLAYLPGGPEMFDRELVFVDRGGEVESSGLDDRPYSIVAVSPSGRSLALEIGAANDTIWIHDLERGASTRLTTARDNERPVWTSDGETLLHHVARRDDAIGVTDIVARAADGSEPPEVLIENGTPASWARLGDQLAFERNDDIWVLDPHDGAEPVSFVATRFTESEAAFSPDGRWLSYVSDESERDEVYLLPYPGKDRRWQVSADGGSRPRWSFDGSELYYISGRTMMVVDVETEPGFSVSSPRPLFELDPDYDYSSSFDVFPDGRFAMIREERDRGATLRVVLHWLDRLRDR